MLFKYVMQNLSRWVFALVFMFSLAGQSLAEQKESGLSLPEKKSISEELIGYMNSMSTQIIEFTHIETTETHKGAILLDRNRGMIINYYPPYPFYIQISSKTGTLFVYDFDMKEHFFEDVSESYLNFFFKPEQIISDFEKISQDNKYYYINYTDEASGSTIIFAFEKKPIKLSYINIVNEQGKMQLAINNIKSVNFKDNNIFKIHNPKIFGPPKIYKQKDITRFIETAK